MTDAALRDAIDFALTHEVGWPRDPHVDPARWGVHHADPAPWNRLRGPVHPRGGVAGVIRQRGRERASWGEPGRADLTFSVAKTYLAMLAGVASREGRLVDVDEPVAARLPGIGFDDEHNRRVTWAHLLEQTSEWQGSSFGVPDTVDRFRKVAHDPRPVAGRKGDARPLRTPGTYWEYNDVRINQLSLALMHLFREPLPEVFEREILRPLGAGEGWRWIGYDDAWVELDGRRMQSVPGGSHWGGGVSISARDQARIGELLLAGGRCGDRQLLPAEWVRRMSQPCALAPFYGWLTWLNPGRRYFPAASEDSVMMVGAGGHYTWVEPALDAVVVVRWIDSAHVGEFFSRAAQALR